MTDFERLSWENRMNFVSAHTYFAPYFNIFDTINSEGEMQEFERRYQHVLKIEEDDDGWNIDYPFNVENLEYVLSKDGKIKIGTTLWLYKADRKINIHDVTQEKLEKYKEAKVSILDKGVSVYYYKPIRWRAARESNAVQLIDYPDLPTIDKRRYYASLDILKREFKDGTKISYRRILALFQQGKKKKLFGYNVYATSYYVVIFSIRGNNWSYADPYKITSSEAKGGRYYLFGYVDGQTFPSFSISVKHGSRGYTSAPQIDYTYFGSGDAKFISYGNEGYKK